MARSVSTVLSTVLETLRVHLRTIVPVGSLVAVGVVLYLVLLATYVLLVGVRVRFSL